ncbi:MAG TPA: hypothetical protein VJ386_01805 [Candidatus Deferrimicrobiaceae bacterium]|nr:hypothetical protein [Candidatus Deferrimicrobiaceae bacterium]
MKLRIILVELVLLAFLSVSIAGYIYSSSARANAVLDLFRDSLNADVCYLMDRHGTTWGWSTPSTGIPTISRSARRCAVSSGTQACRRRTTGLRRQPI